MVADFWERKGKISDCFKVSTTTVLLHCQSEVSFQRKGSGIESKFSHQFLKGAHLGIDSTANPLKGLAKFLI